MICIDKLKQHKFKGEWALILGSESYLTFKGRK
jgi:hypothetical protein